MSSDGDYADERNERYSERVRRMWENHRSSSTYGTPSKMYNIPNTDFPSFEQWGKNRPKTILEEAAELTSQDRQKDYGHPRDDFSKTAAMWSAVLGVEVTPRQVAMCMICVKLSRMMASPGKRDHIVDIAGYARTIEMLDDPL